MTLIEQLEQTTEGSRELDCYIWGVHKGNGQEVKIVGLPTYQSSRFFCNPNPHIDWVGYDLLNIAPHYTTSIDDALTFVPEGWNYSIWSPDNLLPKPKSHCILGLPGSRERSGYASTAPLAVTIAALKARELADE